MRLIIALSVMAWSAFSNASANDINRLIEINDSLVSIIFNKFDSDQVVMNPEDKLSHKLTSHFAKKGYKLNWSAREISVDKQEIFYIANGYDLSNFFKNIKHNYISKLTVMVDETNKKIFVF